MNVPVEIPAIGEGPAYGGAILAMVACGKYESVKQATDKLVKISHTVYPDEQKAQAYEKRYGVFKQLYPALKSVYKNISEL